MLLRNALEEMQVQYQLTTSPGSSKILFILMLQAERTRTSLTKLTGSLGICTCPHGENGSGCAHQAAVALKYGGGNINFIP
jgi:hypothetical protein